MVNIQHVNLQTYIFEHYEANNSVTLLLLFRGIASRIGVLSGVGFTYHSVWKEPNEFLIGLQGVDGNLVPDLSVLVEICPL